MIRTQQYRATNNGRETWFALSCNHGSVSIVPANEPSYEDDDYVYINHRDSMYHNIYDRKRRAMRSCHPPMTSDRMDLEMVFFSGSNYRGNIHGFDMNPGTIHPERARKLARRQTSNAPNNRSGESLVVSAKRASELMQNVGDIRPFARILLRTYQRMNIMSNHDLFLTLRATRVNEDLEELFVRRFSAASKMSHHLSGLRVCFFRNTAMYMTRRWSYDHEYFQRMIDRDNRDNPDVNIALGWRMVLLVNRSIHEPSTDIFL